MQGEAGLFGVACVAERRGGEEVMAGEIAGPMPVTVRKTCL